MINMKKTPEGIQIEYTKGDTFTFAVTSEENLESGMKLRLQISPSGDSDNITVTKIFSPSENKFTVILSESEALLLDIGTIYDYRLTFINADNTASTTISGLLNIKWGA
ncbi:MAG: hypothetical protein IJ460_04540 [Clostridia bacterium]|nr:hypothetical protein [Clostridia bacterium]